MSTTTATTTIPLNKLVPWSGNVRRTGPRAGLGELEASIEAHGLLQSLVVLPEKDDDGNFPVVAGRRRLLALQSLAKAKKIPANAPIACSKLDADADPTEISLVENFQREAMHPADEFEAFNKLHKSGLSAAEIGERNGVDEKAVEKRLKLANVAPSLIKLYRDGGLTLNHMMAFAVTDDHDAQEKVWRDMPTYRRNDPDAIRAQLVEGEISAKDRRVKFVGLAAYEKAGGAIRRDLFAADEDGAFILNKDILSDLVTRKLDKIADSVRKEQPWKWVEAREQFDHSEWSRCSRVYAEPEPLPAKKQAEFDRLNAELEPLLDADDGENEDPRIDQLQAKIDKLEDREKSWQPDTVAIAGVVISISHNGKPQIERGLVKPEDKPKKVTTVMRKQEDGSTVEETVPAGLSAPLTESLTTQRSAALSAVLMGKPDVALAAIAYTLGSQVFYDETSGESCFQLSLRDPYLKGLEGTKALTTIEEHRKRWGESLPKEPEAFWDWCLAAPKPKLHSLLAFCLATSINAVQGKQDRPGNARLTHADQLAKAIGLDMNDWFKVSAENYFGRVSKPLIMEALKEAAVEITPQMEKAKKGELAAMAEREVGKTKWLPTLLRGPAP